MNIVLTGSSSGIGRTITAHLLERGDRVWGIARSDQSDFASAHNSRFFSSRCDVASWENVDRARAEVAAAWSHVDAVVTCAGLHGEIGPALSSDARKWSDTIRANLDGTYFAIRAFAPLLAAAPRRAKIVCFSGGGATKARANFSAYGVAKTGIVRLVETIAVEESSHSLDINAVAPGAINTRLTEEVLALGPTVVGADEFAAAQKQKASGGGSLAKVLDLVDWLLSTRSDGVTGRLLSAPWDRWTDLELRVAELSTSDIYTLRRITPDERGKNWS